MVRIVSVALLIVVMLAGSAAAECAWVLWAMAFVVRDGRTVLQVTDPMSAYTTNAECERATTLNDEREKGRRKQDPGREFHFRCLPDTVDPREAKR